MDFFNKSYPVELTKGPLRVDVGDIAGTYDKNAHSFGARLFQDYKAVDISGCTVSGYFIRPNGYTVTLKGTVENGIAWVKLNENCYYYDGAFTLAVKVTNVGIGTVLVVDGRIIQTRTDSIVDSENTIPSLEEIYAAVDEVEKATAAANTATTNANNAANSANNAAGRSPYIGTNGHWYIWDAASGEFVDSTNPSIPALTFEVQTGAAGSQVQIEQGGTEEAPVIRLTIPRGDTGAVEGVDYYEGTPNALGTASPGTANGLSRGDHVHPMPTAADVGALAANGTAANATKFNSKTYADVLKAIYPVGAVYLSTSSTSPASLFGGSWEQLKDRFLLAAGSTYSAGATAGAAAHSHNLSDSNAYAMLGYTSNNVLHLRSVTPASSWVSTKAMSGLAGTSVSTATLSAAALGVAGKTNSANSMPPYLVVYMWKRVS